MFYIESTLFPAKTRSFPARDTDFGQTDIRDICPPCQNPKHTSNMAYYSQKGYTSCTVTDESGQKVLSGGPLMFINMSAAAVLRSSDALIDVIIRFISLNAK